MLDPRASRIRIQDYVTRRSGPLRSCFRRRPPQHLVGRVQWSDLRDGFTPPLGHLNQPTRTVRSASLLRLRGATTALRYDRSRTSPTCEAGADVGWASRKSSRIRVIDQLRRTGTSDLAGHTTAVRSPAASEPPSHELHLDPRAPRADRHPATSRDGDRGSPGCTYRPDAPRRTRIRGTADRRPPCSRWSPVR